MMSSPSWLVMPFEFMSEFGLSRWGNDVFYPDHSDVERFIRETNIWSSLNHPHVVKCLGACSVGSRQFIVHERVRSLSESASETKEREQVWHRVYEVGLGWQYLHERGLVCGSQMSMENVFCAEVEAKALVFGANLVSLISVENYTSFNPDSTSLDVKPSQQLNQVATDLGNLCAFTLNCLRAFAASELTCVHRDSSGLGDAWVWYDSMPIDRPDFIDDTKWELLTSAHEIDRTANTPILCALERLGKITGVSTRQDKICDFNGLCFGKEDGSGIIDSVRIPVIEGCSVADALHRCSALTFSGNNAKTVRMRLLDVINQLKTINK